MDMNYTIAGGKVEDSETDIWRFIYLNTKLFYQVPF
jgi:hypothetical protein